MRHSRHGEPKPVLITFSKWKDETAIITNRKYRDDLEKKGVRVANDSTRNQESTVAEARKEIKVTYFKIGNSQ